MDESKRTVRRTFSHRVSSGNLYFPLLFAALLVGLAGFLLLPDVDSTNTVSARVQAGDSRTAEIFRQVVRLDDAAGYAVYAKQGIDAEGTTFRGAAGVGIGAEMKGAETAARGNSDVDLNEVSKDLAAAYAAIQQLPCTTIKDGSLSGKTLASGFYCVSGNTLDRGLTFDAKNNPDAVMVIRVTGDFDARAGIILANGAQAHNVHIAVDGGVTVGANVDFKGNIIARGNVTAGEGSIVKGRVISMEGTVLARGAELGGGTGVIEICKLAQPGTTLPANSTYTFSFPAVGGGTQSVTVTLGAAGAPANCSAPREVPSGPITITEASNGTFAIANATARRVGGVNVPVTFTTTTVNVTVLEGDLNNETIVTVYNQPVVGGFIQICKYPTPGDPVSGLFEFRYTLNPEGTVGTSFVPVGSCSLPILITSFVTTPAPVSFVTEVEEVGRDGIVCDSVTTFPGGRSSNFVSGGVGEGCTVDVTVFRGNAANQTLVNFFNRSTAELKICKLLGPGISANAGPFVFDIDAVPTGGGTVDEGNGTSRFVVTVPAGSCVFVPGPDGDAQTFVVGTRATVTERALTGVSVTRIDELNVFEPVEEDLDARSVEFGVAPGVGVITYTNSVLVPGFLKVCKNAIPNVATQPSFTFDVLPTNAGQFEPDFSFGTVTVAGGSCSSPIANVPENFNILVDEVAAAGFNNTDIVCQTGTCTLVSENNTLGQGVINIADDATVGEVIFTNTAVAPPPVVSGVRFDFDGDRKADPSIFMPSSTTWKYMASGSGNAIVSGNHGSANDKLVPADYDGDGKADYAVYRDGHWLVMGSSSPVANVYWGESTDIPQPGDYNNDGKADFVVYRPSTGTWWMQMSGGGFASYHWGVANDKPYAGDYDGDGRMDITVYRASEGMWYTLGTSMGFRAIHFGIATDLPVPADYDGDKKTDVAVYRDGTWYVLESLGNFRATVLGTATDKPVPADYDGDGRADISVFRPSDGNWTIKRSSMVDSGVGTMSVTLGGASDIPIPSL